MPYQVKFISDEALPSGQDWAFAVNGGVNYFFIKRSRVCPDVLAEAWRAWDERDYSSSSMAPYAVNA